MLDEDSKNEANEKIKILKEWSVTKKQKVSCKKFCQSYGISTKQTFLDDKKLINQKGALGLVDKRGKHRKNESKLETGCATLS